MGQSCRGFSATKISPPSRKKSYFTDKILAHNTFASSLSIDPPSSISSTPFVRSRCGPYLLVCVPALWLVRPSSGPRYQWCFSDVLRHQSEHMLLHVGAQTTKSGQLKPPEEVAQRRHYLPLLGMLILALLFKASPTAALMA